MNIGNWLSKQPFSAATCALALAVSACSGEPIGEEALGEGAASAHVVGEQRSELGGAQPRVTACTPQPQPVVLATASTQQAAKFAAQYAIDGNPSTRWSSNTNPDQTLLIDLGKLVNVSGLNINWETAFSRAYRVEWSTDGQIWDPFIFAGATRPGLQRVAGYARTRYVRIHSTAPTDWRSVSIIDVQVIGTLDDGCPNLLPGAWSLTEENVEPPTFDVSNLYSVADNRIAFAYQGKPFTVIGAPPTRPPLQSAGAGDTRRPLPAPSRRYERVRCHHYDVPCAAEYDAGVARSERRSLVHDLDVVAAWWIRLCNLGGRRLVPARRRARRRAREHPQYRIPRGRRARLQCDGHFHANQLTESSSECSRGETLSPSLTVALADTTPLFTRQRVGVGARGLTGRAIP